MKQRAMQFAALALLLLAAGCAGDYETPTPGTAAPLPFAVDYNYPVHLMKEFPVTGSMIVHFSEALDPNTDVSVVTLNEVMADSTLQGIAVHTLVNGQTLVVTPDIPLDPLSRFELTISPDIRSAEGKQPQMPEGGFFLAFDTLAEHPLAGKPLEVTSILPDPETDLVFDFHTFHIHFSEPLDRRTVVNGDTFHLVGDDGEDVAGNVFVRAAQMIFDPDEDLAAGKYTLTLTTAIRDVGGEPLKEETSWELNVITTTPRHQLTVENCPTLGVASSCEPATSVDQLPPHPLTGDYTNAMLVDSLLLGPTRTYVSGQLQAELGDIGDGSTIPMVIRKGQQLRTTNITSMLGGEIPTGLETGESTIFVLADAVGIMGSSTRTSALDGAYPSVELTLDAALSPSSPQAGMLMSQNILGTRLFGSAHVDPDTGKLLMDVAGYAEFFIFGERIRTQMSLTMTDAGTIFDPAPDATPPQLVMTSPLPDEERVRSGSAIYCLFDEPVTPDSAKAAITLRNVDGQAVSVDYLANGPKVLLVPRDPLLPDTRYYIFVEPGLTDIMGNQTKSQVTRRFFTGAVEWNGEPPIVGTTSPGMGHNQEMYYVPGHIPIEVWFSQVMDRDSIVLGDTFQVLDMSTGDEVPGTLIYFFSRIAFYPNEPLTPSHYYRVVLSDEILSYSGVQLSLLRNHQPGGAGDLHEIWIDFIAAERNRWVPLRLQLDPIVDVDGSGYIDNSETVPSPEVNFFKINNPLLPQPSYAAGYMVSYVKGLAYDDEGQPYLDIELIPGISMTATSTKLDFSGLLPGDLSDVELAMLKDGGLLDPLGRIVIDMLGPGDAPSVESAQHLTQMNIAMSTYLVVDNDFMNGSLVHELPLNAVGDLSFSPDGLMVVDISGKTTMKMVLHIPLINIDIPLPLPTTVNMRAVSRNPLSWWNAF